MILVPSTPKPVMRRCYASNQALYTLGGVELSLGATADKEEFEALVANVADGFFKMPQSAPPLAMKLFVGITNETVHMIGVRVIGYTANRHQPDESFYNYQSEILFEGTVATNDNDDLLISTRNAANAPETLRAGMGLWTMTHGCANNVIQLTAANEAAISTIILPVNGCDIIHVRPFELNPDDASPSGGSVNAFVGFF